MLNWVFSLNSLGTLFILTSLYIAQVNSNVSLLFLEFNQQAIG